MNNMYGKNRTTPTSAQQGSRTLFNSDSDARQDTNNNQAPKSPDTNDTTNAQNGMLFSELPPNNTGPNKNAGIPIPISRAHAIPS
jgi:hypothetical protein